MQNKRVLFQTIYVKQGKQVCVPFLLAAIIFLFVSPAFADVNITSDQPAGVVLENLGTGMNATVQPGVKVTSTTEGYAIQGKTEGWNITVGSKAEVTSNASGSSAILLNTKSDGSGTAQTGTINNNGSITGQGKAIMMEGGTVNNSGTIKSGAHGIFSTTGNLDVTNTGRIEASAGSAIYKGDSDGTTTITNSGHLENNSTGWATVRVFNGTVRNEAGGSVKATKETGGQAIQVLENGVVENSGTIEGSMGIFFFGLGSATNYAGGEITASSIGIDFQGNGNVNLLNRKAVNYGKIDGSYAVAFGGIGDDVFENGGSLNGTGGTAVIMGAGNDTVILRAGSDITGHVNGDGQGIDGTGDIAYLEGSGAIKNGTLLNFETIVKTGAGTWTLGGDLSSGKSISVLGGILRNDGTFTQEAGSTYSIGTNEDGTLAHISANKATINSGSTVSVSTKGLRGGSHVIVDTQNGLTGAYEKLNNVDANSALLRSWLSYDAYRGYLNLQSTLSSAAVTRNEQAASTYLETAYNTASGDLLTTFDALHSLDSLDAARSAFNQLTGASHTAFIAVDTARQASFFRNLYPQATAPTPAKTTTEFSGNSLAALATNASSLTDATSSLFSLNNEESPFSIWVRGHGAKGNRTGEDIASRYDYTIQGFIAGVDFFVTEGFRAGAALGYSKTDVEFTDLSDSGSVDSFQTALYGTWKSGKWYADGALSLSRNSYDTTRSISFGTISHTAAASYSGYELGASVESGYKADWMGFEITPLASVLALRNHRNDFTETGADSLNLVAEAEDATFLQGALGLRIARTFTLGESFSLIPEISGRWVHEFGNDETVLNARLNGATAGSFAVYSDTIGRNSGVFSLGLTGKITDTFTFSLAYTGELRSSQTSHAATAAVRLNW
ncbi:MAG: autotransporter domain-containing protein [Syntrophales bacterium]